MSKLVGSRTKSCGCYRRTEEHRRVIGLRARTHGHCNNDRSSRTYMSWTAMIRRCYRETAIDYYRYGGKGIRVCDRWRRSFVAFLEDMGERPLGMSLDRINNEGNYEPGNCKWSTAKEQSRNTSWNRRIPFRGQMLPLAQVAELTGINQATIQGRIRCGWSWEEITSVPAGTRRPSRKRTNEIKTETA